MILTLPFYTHLLFVASVAFTMTTKEVEFPAEVKPSGVFTEMTVFHGLSAVNFASA